MKTSIAFEVDTDYLDNLESTYLAALWHLGQFNPAPSGDAAAAGFAESIGREIIRRWLAQTPPALWHQGHHLNAHVGTVVDSTA